MSMWTEETIEKLIELYKEHPSLWDPKDKNYKNRLKKQASLKIISSAMNMEVVDVERKLNVLITQFRRTHKKVLNMKKSGIVGDVERHLWYGYKLLLFLEDRFNTALLRSGSLQNQHEAQKPKPHESTSHHPTATILRSDYTPMKNNNVQTVSRPVNEAIVLMNNVPSKRQVDKDEYDYYGEQIACKLRKMDEITRINTQHRINCIIHETEMKLLSKRYGCPPLTVSTISSVHPFTQTQTKPLASVSLEPDKNGNEPIAIVTVKSDVVK